MTYNLSEAVFSNDFYAVETDGGNTIIFNLIDEQIHVGTEDLALNAINVAVVDNNGIYHEGVNIIGESNDFYALQTNYTEYLGLPLTKDNMKYCTLEVSDD